MKVEAAPAEPRPTEVRRLGLVPGLDGIRGIALVCILFSHSVLLFYPARILDTLPGTVIAVDVFFVLSGFLITAMLLGEQHRTDRVSMPNFYRRRALRLLPALVALLAIHFVYAAATGLPLGVEAKTMAVTLGNVANWYQITGHELAPGFQHVWTLSVEEQFYLLWPLVTVAILSYRRSTTFIVGCFVAAIAAIVVWRIHVWVPDTPFFGVQKFHYRTDLRADAILIGALTAHLWTRRKTPTVGLNAMATVALAFIVFCLFYVRENGNFIYYGGFVPIAVATSLITLAVIQGGWFFGRMFNWSPARVVGRMSYGLYLWHLPVFFAVARYTVGWRPWLQTSLALTITALFGVGSWYLVETPFIRLKNGKPREKAQLTPAP